MNIKTKLLSIILVLCFAVCALAGCKGDKVDTGSNAGANLIDYVAQTKLNLSSETKKAEVTVKSFIDGDTTHFNVPTDISPDGVLKARYMGINTPESTGKIEPWGKKASNFTKEKLSNAVSIYIESNDSNWNVDSTGGRHLVYIWYKPSENEEYRCLNLDLIQNGLSISCGTMLA